MGQPVQEGLLGQSARQRDQEDRGQDHWKEGCSMQEAATGSKGGSPGVHKGQRASGSWPHPLRVHGVGLLARSLVLEKLPQFLTSLRFLAPSPSSSWRRFTCSLSCPRKIAPVSDEPQVLGPIPFEFMA